MTSLPQNPQPQFDKKLKLSPIKKDSKRRKMIGSKLKELIKRNREIEIQLQQ